MQCAVCNEDTLGNESGLCYLHRKYKAGVTGPYFETLYDLVYWKATTLKEWDRLGYGKISVACAPHVEVQKMTPGSVEQVRKQVEEQLNTGRGDLSSFQPLVLKWAAILNSQFGTDFADLHGEGMLALMRLSLMVPEGTQCNAVAQWVKRSVVGIMRNFALDGGLRGRGVSASNAGRFDDETWVGTEDQHEDYIAAERMHRGANAMAELIKKLTWDQRKILSNMLKDNPRTQKELAKAMGVKQPKISKDTTAIFTKAKEMEYG